MYYTDILIFWVGWVLFPKTWSQIYGDGRKELDLVD